MTIATTLCPLSLQTLQEDGKPLIGAKIYISATETTTPKTVFKDFQCQVSHPRPVLTNAQGRVPPIFVGSGVYRIRILKPDNTPLEDIDGLLGGVVNDGGEDPQETYPLTDENSVLRTGDVLWSYRTGPRKGFTPCNGGTIGQETSGATNIAVGLPSSQTQPEGSAFKLFRFLWENDPKLPVYASGVAVQRSSTALSDWDINRTLGVPDLRGRTIFGLDTMGNINANVIQISTDITSTAGNAKVTVASASGLCVGMFVTVVGIPEGATIKVIEGLSVTLSALPTSTLTQAKARFSMFSDAQKLGSLGGSATHSLVEGELAEHKHGATSTSGLSGEHTPTGTTEIDGDHVHQYADGYFREGASGAAPGSNAGASDRVLTTYGRGEHWHRLLINKVPPHLHPIVTEILKAGKNAPHNNIPPAVLGTFYMKL